MTERDARYRRILIATDGSDTALEAARHAIQLAQWSGAELFALSVVDAPDARRLGLYAREALTALRREAQAAVSAVVERAAAQGIVAQPLVVDGDPRRSVIEQAGAIGADLIVIGARGVSAIERLLLGSVSEQVVRYSKAPVLVVRTDSRADLNPPRA